MRGQIPKHAVGALADAQHGVVARWQLRDLGVSASRIDRWVADALLLGVHRGVYAVGHRRLRPDGHRLAAVLAGGPGAVLSHRAAAAAWNVRPDHRTRCEITVIGARGRTLPGTQVHQRRLDRADVTVLDGIPITTLAQTFVDLAAVVREREVRGALDRAEKLQLLDLRAIDAALRRHPQRAGTRRLRGCVERYRPEPALPRSWLEEHALALIVAAGLPRPAVNQRTAGHDLDLTWNREGLVVELDSRTHHLTTVAFEEDRRRDAELIARGYRVMRFTYRQATEEPQRTLALIAAALGQGPPPRAAPPEPARAPAPPAALAR